MKRIKWLFIASYREFRQVHTLTGCAMLGAVAVVLSAASIELTSTLRIGFSTIPNELVHYLFGPVVGCFFGGAMDIIKYVLKPTGAYFPGLTLVPMVAGLIYGSFFYAPDTRRIPSFARVLAAHLVVSLICNVGLNTLCLAMLTGKAFFILLPARALKNLLMWPIDSIVFYHVVKLLGASGALRLLRPEGAGAHNGHIVP